MAQLASQAKAGFYPTPPEMVERIAAMIEPVEETAGTVTRMLDPCCGEGAALRQLANLLTAKTGEDSTRRYETFGVELDRHRAEAAKAVLDHAIRSDAFRTSMTNGAFQIIWLNPPYDDSADGGRMEHTFLVHATRYLAPGGLLVFIVPQRRLGVSAKYLSSHFGQIACYRFPDPLFDAFHQVALFGVKKDVVVRDSAIEVQVHRWAETRLQELPLEPGHRYAVRPVPERKIAFSSVDLDAEAAVEEAKRSGWWASNEFQDRLWPRDEGRVRPLMPLRKGHLSLLIVSGFLNSLVLTSDTRRVLVKGRTRKEYVLAEETPETETYREVLRTAVTVLDLATGEFDEIET